MKTEEQTELTDSEESVGGNILATLKPFLLGIAGLALVLGILILLPMFLTYLSEGDARPLSQIHPADPVGKSNHTFYKPVKSNK